MKCIRTDRKKPEPVGLSTLPNGAAFVFAGREDVLFMTLGDACTGYTRILCLDDGRETTTRWDERVCPADAEVHYAIPTA